MEFQQDPLWQRLAVMQIEPDGAAITFAAKLAREQGWSPAHAEAVIKDYQRFLYLAATERDPVSPSEAIDRCWHLHLTYSRHYWEELCGNILGRPLHHDPSLGGAAEDERHSAQYGRTLARYREIFGEEPPATIWPSGGAASRSVSRPRGVPRLLSLTGGAAATLALAACAAASSGGGQGSGGVNWPVALSVGAVMLVIFALIARSVFNRSGGGRHSDGSGCGGGSGCGSSSYDSSSSDSGSSDSGGSSCGGGGCGGGGD